MKPLAFRIWDFKSIQDSGECPLSGDGITVLAGQNESGKTAVLQALRDFDLDSGVMPFTPDYIPDGSSNPKPRVAVRFSLEAKELAKLLHEENWIAPQGFLDEIASSEGVWIIRDLLSGTFTFDDATLEHWSEWQFEDAGENAPSDDDADSIDSANLDEAQVQPVDRRVRAPQLAIDLRFYWPKFVYFDSFEDALPREVAVSEIIEQVSAPRQKPIVVRLNKSAPTAVQDFIMLSDLDIERLNALSTDDKALGNYLRSCSANITGDFLKYWKQRAGASHTVELRVQHHRDVKGFLKLLFFVHDTVDQYPDQRSKGFLWFLSFFLRLAAAQKVERSSERVVLVDEPGTFLHARAQKDVLHLFEDRIAPREHVIYSTHSPYLLPPEKLYRVRIAVKSPQKGTLILDRLTHPALRGKEFADSLSPVLTMIGIDVTDGLDFVRENNLLVEGISDHFYIMSWGRLLRPSFLEKCNVFPGFGATTLPTLAALFIGWRLAFAVLLDRDDEGSKAKTKLTRHLSVSEDRVVHPKDGMAIEDLFSEPDFQSLLQSMDSSNVLVAGEAPTAAIKRLKVDKILLARTFAERAAVKGFAVDKDSKARINRLFDILEEALEKASAQ